MRREGRERGRREGGDERGEGRERGGREKREVGKRVEREVREAKISIHVTFQCGMVHTSSATPTSNWLLTIFSTF